MDLRKAIEPSGRTTTFEHDRFGRITKTTVEDGGSEAMGGPAGPESDPPFTEYRYNWRSQVIDRILPEYVPGYGEAEVFNYDTSGKVIVIGYTRGGGPVYGYDGAGRQISLGFPEMAVGRQYTYNQAGRMVSDQFYDESGLRMQTFYGYDQAGHRISQVRDRHWPPGGTPPHPMGWTPTDGDGNPIIPTAPQESPLGEKWSGTAVNGLSDSSDFTLTWIDLGSGNSSLVVTAGVAEVCSATAHYDDVAGITTIIPIYNDVPFEPLKLQGEVSIKPTFSPQLEEAFSERRIRDPQFNLEQSIAKGTEISPILVDRIVTVERDCCRETILAPGGVPLLESERGRAQVQGSLGLSASALTQQGSVPPLAEPWAGLLDPLASGLQGMGETQTWQQGSGGFDPGDPREYENFIEDERKFGIHYDPVTGLPINAETGEAELPDHPVVIAADAFGRPVYYEKPPANEEEAKRYSLFQDWVSGERQWSAPEDPPPSGAVGEAFTHGPGYTRVQGIDAAGETTRTDLLLRGPQGQVRATAGSGGIDGRAGYNAWGGPAYQAFDGILPAYVDNDWHVTPDPSIFPSWKMGAGVLTDTTPGVGSLSGSAASGAAGMGFSGNPDIPPGVGSTQFGHENPHSFEYKRKKLMENVKEDVGFSHGTPDWRSHGGGGLPGMAGDKSPIGAPGAVAEDTASIADQRLGSVWPVNNLLGASSYSGPAPGQQTGDSGWDDTRNPRMPLPAQRGAGMGGMDLSGPPGWTMTRAGNMPAGPELMIATLPGSEPNIFDSGTAAIRQSTALAHSWGWHISSNGQPGIEHPVRPLLPEGTKAGPTEKTSGAGAQATSDESPSPDAHSILSDCADAIGAPRSMFDGGPRNSAGAIGASLYGNAVGILGQRFFGELGYQAGYWLGSNFGYALGEAADYAAGGALSRGLDAHPGLTGAITTGVDVAGGLASGRVGRGSKGGLATGRNLVEYLGDEGGEQVAKRGLKSSGKGHRYGHPHSTLGEDQYRKLTGGVKKEVRIGDEVRVYDSLTVRGRGGEYKSGYQSGPRIVDQIRRDGLALRGGQIKSLEWYFDIGQSGRWGASDEVYDALRLLKKEGLDVEVWIRGHKWNWV